MSSVADRRRAPRGGRRASDGPGRNPLLLVAESDARTRKAWVQYLEERGFRVLEASRGDEALAIVHQTPPRVILSELSLPVMPVWRFSAHLAGAPETRDIPVIVLSPVVILTDDFEAKTEAPIASEPAGLLVKPFRLPALLEEVRRVLRTR